MWQVYDNLMAIVWRGAYSRRVAHETTNPIAIVGQTTPVASMTDPTTRRVLADRRHEPRGGRRAGDQEGFTPVIVLIDERADRRQTCADLLLHARFAVVPFESTTMVLPLLDMLEPAAIIVSAVQLDAITAHAPVRHDETPVPIVPLKGRGESIIHALRLAFSGAADREVAP